MSSRKATWMTLLFVVVVIAVIGVTGFRRSGVVDDPLSEGLVALDQGDWRKVSQQIDRLRRMSHTKDEVRLLRGGLLLRTGNPKEAVRELSQIVELGQYELRGLLLLTESQYASQRWPEAEATAKKALQKAPNNPDAHRFLGAIYYDLGAISEAESHLRRLTELQPGDHTPHRLLGLIHKDFGRFHEAVADYKAALGLLLLSGPQLKSGSQLEIQKECAFCQIQLGDFTQALATLQATRSEDIDARILLAECRWALQERDEAKQILKSMTASDSQQPVVLRLGARIAVDEGDFTKAVDALERLVVLDPFDHQSLLLLSSTCRRLNRVTEADQYLAKRNAVVEQVQRMSDLSNRAIQEPGNAAIRFELAEVCDRLGKPELATAWRQAGLALRGDSQ